MREKQENENEGTPTPKRRGRPRAAAGARGLPRLRRALAVAKMTQTTLAARLGVLHCAINMYVRGKSDPSIDRLRTIAQILDCSVADLVYPPPAVDAAPAVVADPAATA